MSLLARILLNEGYITKTELQRAIVLQIISGKRLGRILVEEKIISDVTLNRALSIRFGVEPLPAELLINPPPPVVTELMTTYPVYPWKKKGKILKIAMLDPTDKTTLAKITYKTGTIAKPHSIPELTLRRIYKTYDIPIPEDKFYIELIKKKIETIPEGKKKIEEAKSSHEVLEAILKTVSLVMKNPLIFIIIRSRLEIFGSDKSIIVNNKKMGMFKTVLKEGSVYIGKPILNETEKKIYGTLKKNHIPPTVILIPVRLKGKIVNIIYGERWEGREEALPELVSLTGAVKNAYEKLLGEKWEKLGLKN